MAFHIRKAGVIGSGTMGGGIAALLAGVGIPVTLLDIPSKGTNPGDPAAKRNAMVADNLGKLKKSRIPAIFHPDDVDRVQIGNLDDDLEKLSDADWIIEVIVERLDVKQALMAKLEEVRKPGSIISSNTSGLSINAIAEGRSEDFQRHFLGTHFFNPPRHLKLLEIIPGQHTDPEVVEFMSRFGADTLGKGVVPAKDTPNFIANRFVSIVGTFGTAYAIRNGFTVEEVDSLTGPLIGRPKSGTFRLSDVVGNDIFVHVAANLYPNIPDDPEREILKDEGVARVYDFLMKNNYLGDKTGQGFFKKVEKDGAKEFWPLDLNTLEYVPPQKVRFDSVGKVRKIEDTAARIKALVAESDRAAQYVWHLHAYYLAYASQMVGQIADDLQSIDNANKWGFAHELGAFEIWDALGVAETTTRIESDGYKVAAWVHEMLNAGITTFYQRDNTGALTGVYDPVSKNYKAVAPDTRTVTLNRLRQSGKEVFTNAGASLIDLDDGVLLMEFHTKANTLDTDIMAAFDEGFARLDSDFDAMIVSNQGDMFSAGANLMLIAMTLANQDFTQLEALIKQGQDLAQRMRFFHKPVVAAPFDKALGGGCEFSMGAQRIVAHAELYIGLVEMGIGVIPGFGGCKEMVRRVVNPVARVQNADTLPAVQKVFEQIALAKVSTSAMEARAMGILTDADHIVMNRDHLIAEAKTIALDMAHTFTPVIPEKVYAAGQEAKSALTVGVYGMASGKYITEYEAKLARKLAGVLCGGNLTSPGWMDEQYFLDLERETFLSLAGEQKTLERIQHMLTTGKPLRN